MNPMFKNLLYAGVCLMIALVGNQSLEHHHYTNAQSKSKQIFVSANNKDIISHRATNRKTKVGGQECECRLIGINHRKPFLIPT